MPLGDPLETTVLQKRQADLRSIVPCTGRFKLGIKTPFPRRVGNPLLGSFKTINNFRGHIDPSR